MYLLIDIGNSRLKWAVKKGGSLKVGPSLRWDTNHLEEFFETEWRHLQRPRRILLANVAGARVEKRINDWTQMHWQISLEHVRPRAVAFGVKNSYADPSKLGADRWVCLLAARQNFSLPACIVDCGTAITVDYLDQNGIHCGGLIIPGLNLMKDALTQRANAIDCVDEEPSSVFGKSTGAAIRSGTILAACGMVEQVLREIENDFGDAFSLIVTGGDGEYVAARLSRPYRMVPDLVLQGLAVMT